MTKRHPCGCTSPRPSLDPRHTIHYDSTTPDDPIDEGLAAKAFGLLEHARAAHREGCEAQDARKIESARRLYKEAAMAYGHAGDAVGAIVADSYDTMLDDDVERVKTWDPLELRRYYGLED